MEVVRLRNLIPAQNGPMDVFEALSPGVQGGQQQTPFANRSEQDRSPYAEYNNSDYSVQSL
jgi:hypothetical protein